MKVWILVLIALVLFVCTLREPFNPATERPSTTDESLKTAVISIVGVRANPVKYIEVLQKFYDEKYIPDKRTPSPAVISSFISTLPDSRDIDKTRLPRLIDYIFLSVEALDEVDYTCPEGFMRKDGTCKGRQDDTKTANPICPLTYDFKEDTKKCLRQGARTGAGGSGTSGATGTDETGTGGDETGAGGVAGTGGSGAGGTAGGAASEASGAVGGAGGAASGASGVAGGAGRAGTGPTRQGAFSLPGRNVLGPAFSGLGEGTGWDTKDTTSSNQYPELLGGGAGGAAGGGAGRGAGGGFGGFGGFDLPGTGSLGTDANARFLPFSRQPGDMDVIADPWRVSQTFTSSSYSSKTDPVPFLNDFSAFQK